MHCEAKCENRTQKSTFIKRAQNQENKNGWIALK